MKHSKTICRNTLFVANAYLLSYIMLVMRYTVRMQRKRLIYGVVIFTIKDESWAYMLVIGYAVRMQRKWLIYGVMIFTIKDESWAYMQVMGYAVRMFPRNESVDKQRNTKRLYSKCYWFPSATNLNEQYHCASADLYESESNTK